MRHTGGGFRLLALTVLAVGSIAVPSLANPDPSHVPPGQGGTPPGQAKKQDAAQPQAAAATPQRTAVTTQPAPATTTTQFAKKSSSKPAQPQSSGSLPPGQAKKVAAAPVAAAPAPAPAPAPAATSAPVTNSSGSFTAAKHRTKKAARRRARTSGAARTPASSIRRSAPATAFTTAGRKPSHTNARKTVGNGFVPAKPKVIPAKKDQTNVVFRSVRDAVEVIPVAIWILLGLLTALAALFAVTSARQTRRAHRLAAERGELLGDVGVLQEAVLPVVPPRVGALALSVAHRPAGGPAAGGDLYDVVALDNDRTALIVGDVSGHGPGALGHATIVRFTLRAHIESGAGPREALAIAAESLSSHFDEGFATAAVALHDPEKGTLTYATAAHEAPIVIGPGAHQPIVVSSTPPLGIGGPPARRQTIVPFPKGSLATMLTDGALEARLRGELVGRARVEEWVREMGERPAAGDMAEMIRERAAVSDDLAVCFATSLAGEDTGNWRIEELHRPTAEEAARFLDACGATDAHKRSVAEALRFANEHSLLTVRLENGAVVSAEVVRENSPHIVAA